MYVVDSNHMLLVNPETYITYPTKRSRINEEIMYSLISHKMIALMHTMMIMMITIIKMQKPHRKTTKFNLTPFNYTSTKPTDLEVEASCSRLKSQDN